LVAAGRDQHQLAVRQLIDEALPDLGRLALGSWGERWLELAPEHLDPGVVLNAWVSWYLARDLLPDHRVVVRLTGDQRS
jgi:hypothetical protein